MSRRRAELLRTTDCSKAIFLSLVLLTLLLSAHVATSQTPGSNFPGPAIREGNRAMDDYDRTINRMKNDARAANERRRSLFPQINEDYQRIQVIHNEIVRMLQPDKRLDYDRLVDLTGDMKKRSARLRENLALPEGEQTEAQSTHSEPIDEARIKKSIGELHDVVVSFIGSPLFKNLGVVDAKVVDGARKDLDNIISISDEIKKEAKSLRKFPKN